MRKDKRVKIFLTDEEYEELFLKAKELDITVTNYVYRKALDKPIYYGAINPKE